MSSLSPEFRGKISHKQHDMAEREHTYEAYIAQRQREIDEAISQRAAAARERLPTLLDDSHAIGQLAVSHRGSNRVGIAPTAHYGTRKIRPKSDGYNDLLHTPTLQGWTLARITNYQAPYADPTKKIPDIHLIRDVVLNAEDQELYLADISYNIGDIKKTNIVKAMYHPESPHGTNPWILPENPCNVRNQLTNENLSDEVLSSLDIDLIYDALATFVHDRHLNVE